MNVEHKSYPIIDLKKDDETGIIEAIVSVFNNIDSGKEIVREGFFQKSIERKLPKGVWAHDWKQPIAKTLEAKELAPGDPSLPSDLKTLGGCYIKGQFNLDTQRGREAYSDIKFGIVDEFSIGYSVLRESKDKDTGARELLEGDWKEWSPVLVGMNDRTELISIKAENETDQIETKGMFEDTLAKREESFYFLFDVLCSALYSAEYLNDYGGAADFNYVAAVDQILSEFTSRMRAAVVGDQVDVIETAASRQPIDFKGDLRERLPFAKHTEIALGAVEVFANRSAALIEILSGYSERSKSIMELREAKAGAVYSSSNLTHMTRIHDAMGKLKKDVSAMHGDMAALIAKAKKKDEKADDESEEKLNQPELDVAVLRMQSREARSRALTALYTHN